MTDEDKSIFVKIASYRDPECKHTIDDLFSKAKDPARIYVGINWQYAEEDADTPYFSEKEYSKRIRIVKHHYSKALGIGWARSIAQKLYRDEDFVLSIDAHMRFVAGWDHILIEMNNQLQAAGYLKPVITCYPPDYYKDGNLNDILKKMAPVASPEGIFIHKRTGHVVEDKTEPFLHPCLAAGFWFSQGIIINEVPHDPEIYFMGEEILLAARMWTNGWDMFHPGRNIVYHMYKKYVDKNSGDVKASRSINLHRTDHESSAKRNHLSHARVRHLLGTEISPNPIVTKDINKYKLGKTRSIYQYELFSGINFQNLTTRAFTRTGIHFAERLPLGCRNETRAMKLAENLLTNADNSSSMAKSLGKIIRFTGCKSVLDIGGNLALYPHIIDHYLKPANYYALIFSKTLAEKAAQALNKRKCRYVIRYNYSANPLPYGELSFIGNNINSMPAQLARQILFVVANSQADFLCVCHNQKTRNFLLEPFYLPEPDLQVDTPNHDSKLSFWELDFIRLLFEPLPEPMIEKRVRLFNTLLNCMQELSRVFNRCPELYLRLLRDNLETSGEKVKECLALDEVSRTINSASEKGRNALDSLMGLRWRPASVIGNIIPDHTKFDAIFAMGFTCDFIEETIAFFNKDRNATIAEKNIIRMPNYENK